MDQFRQCELQSGQRQTIAWLPDDPRLGVGATFTLRGHGAPPGWWTVMAISEPAPRPDYWRPRMFGSLAGQ